jgi:DNA modification methylase
MLDSTVAPLKPSSIALLHGDAETRLRDIPPDTFHACVTSPPYFGLRRYGGAEIGHETTPDGYAARLRDVFREVRRTLRPDGSLWLVLGDSYANDTKWGGSTGGKHVKSLHGNTSIGRLKNITGLKSKDLIGIPWLTAFTLRADGWYLREAIVWRKSSCMPESVTDRCTIQHEYVFHLTKSPTYYHDPVAIEEAAQSDHPSGNGFKRDARVTYTDANGARGSDEQWTQVGGSRNARSVWDINPEPFESQLCLACDTYYAGAAYRRLPRDADAKRICACGANDRWLSHFAVFPTRLVSRCLRASVPSGGCCVRCATPFRRIVEKKAADPAWLAACGADASGSYTGISRDGGNAAGAQDASATKARILAGMARKVTVGWLPDCKCDAGIAAPLALDPFSGAGTTALCASRLGIDAVGIDLNADYLRMSRYRLADAAAKCLDTDGVRLPFAMCDAAIG